MSPDFSTTVIESRRQQNNIKNVLKINNCQTSIIYPARTGANSSYSQAKPESLLSRDPLSKKFKKICFRQKKSDSTWRAYIK